MASLSSTGPAKDQFVLGLAALVCHSTGSDASADNLTAIITASGNKVPAYYAPLYASSIEKAGGVDKMFTKIGGGAAPAAAVGKSK
jgi:ribosomal protein L12E/L44/L45/RPP1/RPP2